MARGIRRKLAGWARHLDLGWLASLSGQEVIFPIYHVVSAGRLPHTEPFYHTPDEKTFERDLDALLQQFHPLSIEEYASGETGPGRGKAMVLSFDDGLRECRRVIAPLLKRKGVPALFFLNNDFIDNRGLFFRYRAGILLEHLRRENHLLSGVAEYLSTPEDKVTEAVLGIRYRQQSLLDELALLVGLNFPAYLKDHPVYMSSREVEELVAWGFHIGAHSSDHAELFLMEEEAVAREVKRSVEGLKNRFLTAPFCFAFPFSSDGIPERVIGRILEEGIADLLFGTAGMKRTGRWNFIQRIPMDTMELPAKQILQTEFLYYLLKAPFGRNRYFRKG